MIDDIKDIFKATGLAVLIGCFVMLILLLFVGALNSMFAPSSEHKAAMRVPELLSEADGCKVYRFVDSGTHYFTRCGSHVETVRNYTENCGKACTRNRTETLTTEGNK
jgi:hypothetical protein